MPESRVLAVLALVAVTIPAPGHAAAAEKPESSPPPSKEATSTVATTEGSTAVYKPPRRGAPGGRVGGATRGAGGSVLAVSVLAPDHTGLTTSEHPSLYWYISGAASSPVEVTVLDPRVIKPLMQIYLSPPVAAGVHRIRLADHDIRLQPGVAYRWYVAVVPNANRRSKDILAGGAIERVAAPDGLDAELAKVSPADSSSLYAEAGLWYDAVASISALIESAPEDRKLRRPRAALLAQVGLPDIGE